MSLKQFFLSRFAAKETATTQPVNATTKTCPNKVTVPWKLKVTVNTKPSGGTTQDLVTIDIDSGIPTPPAFKLASQHIVDLTGTNDVDTNVGASTPGWIVENTEHVVLAPGDDEAILLTLTQWKLHVTVESRHKGKWPTGTVSVAFAGAHESTKDVTMTSDRSSVADLFNGPPANGPVTVTLGDPDWRLDTNPKPMDVAIKAPEDKAHTVFIKRRWKLTVNVDSIFPDIFPDDSVTLTFPGGLPSTSGTLNKKLWSYELTGFDDVDGALVIDCPTWKLMDVVPPLKLRGDTDTTINVKLGAWRLKVNVESTTAFGWPKDDVIISFANPLLASRTLKMNAKTGFVHMDGYIDLTKEKLKAEVTGGWTLEAEAEVTIACGDTKQEVTLKLKGVDIAFELVDAATPPVGVANEKVKVLREDGTDAPGAPTVMDGAGLVKLTNVPPENYKIKFPDRYDVEWEFSKEEDL